MPDPTPGQVAFETFSKASDPATWDALTPELKATWESVAEAVLTSFEPVPPPIPSPTERGEQSV